MKHSSNAIVVFNKKILLLLRDNIPTINDPNTWSLIGGGVEKGESFEKALKREMKEEIGTAAEDITYLGKVILSGHISAIYFAKLNKFEVEKIRLGDEGQELKFFTHNEIKDLKLTKNLRKYLDRYGNYLIESIKLGKTPNPNKLGLK